MASPPIVAALEIGTTRVRALVGEFREDGYLMIIGCGECTSAGVRKSEVVDFDHALSCVRTVLQTAEEQSNTSIRVVHLVLSGGHFRSDVNRGTVHVMNAEREITAEEMERVHEAARTLNLPPDREVIHSISQNYLVDSNRVVNPEGMEASQLAHDMLIIHGAGPMVRNAIRVVRTVPVDVQDVAFGGLCSALSVLTSEQKASGVVAIDLGGGTTDYLVYATQVVAHAGCIGVGGDHVTNDIALGLKIPTAQAERLKVQHGRALLLPAARTQTVALAPEGGFPGRTVRLSDLHTIINARMDETLRLVRADLERRGMLHHLGAGVVLTGGGAMMNGVTDLVERIFNLPCVIGQPRAVSGLASVTGGPEYAATTGMLKYGMMTMQRPSGVRSIREILRNIFAMG